MTKEAGKMEVGHAIVTAFNSDSQGREVVINLNGQKDMISLRLVNGLATGWYRGFNKTCLYSMAVADTDRALRPEAADMETALGNDRKQYPADVVALANEAHAGQKPGMGVTPADIAEAIMKDRLAATEFNKGLGRKLETMHEDKSHATAKLRAAKIDVERALHGVLDALDAADARL